MKRVLQVNLRDNTCEIDLDIVKKYHIRFLADSNKINFGIQRSDLNCAERVTEALFNNNNYAINWIHRNLTWDHVADYLSTNGVTQPIEKKEWDHAEKIIIEK